jgi:23S rRNA (uridine2552-2'-O)-methyltransferase
VIGVDLKPVMEGLAPNVFTSVGDVEKVDAAALKAIGPPPGGLFDVVLSDMAPNTTGHGDDLVSARLCERVLALLPGLLKPGGHLAMKIFEGSEYPRLLREVQRRFGTAKGFKPEASREVSREMYLIGLGYAPKKSDG